MTFDQNSPESADSLPLGRFHEGCHAEVLNRLDELLGASHPGHSAQVTLTLARQTVMDANLLGCAVARTTQPPDHRAETGTDGLPSSC